ncbi:MAG: sigma-70 family RNA polymerase sigma factor [Clostridia bacterium]|nr:sigma-70 family RNA polymerase sigma factor [Clostridia bacterium]
MENAKTPCKAEEPYKRNTELAVLAAKGDDDACAELVEMNMGLVRGAAQRFAGRGTETEDLIQLGCIGLIKAARSFDAEKGCAFSTYAVPLILGEIKRHLRDNGQMKVSRSIKKTGAELLRESERCYAETGREARLSELAERCGIDIREAAEALDAVSPLISLSEPLSSDQDDGCLEDILAQGENETERLVERLSLRTAISKLPSLWKSILELRYARELSQQRTAELLGLSQVKISREEKKMLAFLRREMS